MTLVVTGIATVHEADGDKVVRSKSLTFPLPKIIVLVRYVFVKFIDVDGFADATHKSILARDRGVCIYCADKAMTIDHIMPRSRGGGNNWTNLAACCFRCNNIKADRTPEEAGMKLLWEPRVRKQDNPEVQKHVWDSIGALV